ncbi:phage holin family protein [Vagococcus sp. PNs007]|uniref:Phage holin family protein n=1 Tax=Vagococcus proximus TaxID=2991417 RepID=A0ABT5X2P0_9ENTE|nr:phage holin family protein [Vagococcus proximus]MDF0480276.1 phage holin family protein [Vagococcus proximus]
MDFMSLIVEEGYVMVPVLWIIGYAVKRSDVLDDKYILPLLIVISVCFTPCLLGGYVPLNFVQAILVAGGAVLIDQVKKQTTRPLVKNKEE